MKRLSTTNCLLLIMLYIKKQLLQAQTTSSHKKFPCFNLYKTAILLQHLLLMQIWRWQVHTWQANKYESAIKPLNTIIATKNGEAFKPQAYLKLGVSYYNLKDHQNALNNFQKLISTYPNAPESDEAIEYVSSIFIDRQKPDEFVDFMQKSGKPVSYSAQDSISFITAQNAYNNRSFDNALQGFKNYLTKFPDGQYAVEASYMLADVYNTRKDFSNAITYYNNVAQKAPNSYAEQSVLQAARIAYFENEGLCAGRTIFSSVKIYCKHTRK